MPFSINRRYRHIRRYRQIGEILLRHGFGYLLQQTGLIHLLPPLRRLQAMKRNEEQLISVGNRIRLVLEELGPTFIKFGQLLSTRADLLPPDIITELERLQDDVGSIPFEKVQRQVEGELEQPLEQLFSVFETKPLAAASIGQVHYARLPDGTEVVVKVRRPGVERTIGTDLEILYGFARALQDRLSHESLDSVGIVDEFARVVRKELDYTREGRNITRFRDFFKDSPDVVVPYVYWSHTTKSVLTMRYIKGIKISDFAALTEQGQTLEKLASIIAKSFLKQIFKDGFYHGDPHPGNILVTPEGKIAYIDFGIVGRVDRLTMQALAELLVSITKRDVDGLLRVLAELDAFKGQPTREMRLDFMELIDIHYGKTLKELDFTLIAEDLLELIRRHPIRLPSDLLLLVKALVTVEGVGTRLAPDFNSMELAEPFANDWIQQHYSVASITERTKAHAGDWARFAGRLPQELDSVLQVMNEGEFQIHFRHEGLDKLINRLDIISNRLTFGLIIGSLIVGSSLLINIDQGPRLMQIPIIGLSGFLMAGLIGLWLLISILRSGRY